MADIVTGLRQAIQDLVAPDLKAIQAKQDATTLLIDAFRAEMRSEFASLRAANKIEVLQQVYQLKERLSVLEIKPARKLRKVLIDTSSNLTREASAPRRGYPNIAQRSLRSLLQRVARFAESCAQMPNIRCLSKQHPQCDHCFRQSLCVKRCQKFLNRFRWMFKTSAMRFGGIHHSIRSQVDQP